MFSLEDLLVSIVNTPKQAAAAKKNKLGNEHGNLQVDNSWTIAM